ncbi:MAG TPA: succinate dehydrogenase/fumarate reductase flavoprotein subunit [Deltaproteobacteria bacterium]|nr:MAG: fumarate reductase [Deltaproteobacteria bacterium GWA2_55_82]OGQ63626.1 MAG: fumarate reductase [Deltaproteobacteria bacterium RIFCSPLOWO2_02_FULL_55_12]OIJ74461.1 MAG: fumarate reductase [Deltaproteobacteria bacterium GWC2_55_46]HBG47118.1 succinate dehydrogenase/fumarate reductase flavoprotein subunit [Deltaproteobacteria bacterium]HCY10822.1 succinate dehydrogenase/fumarate reductase flavoprotein subunit [Deltaproteobacteria bacterium]
MSGGYTTALKELIKKVEATRAARVEKARKGDHFPALTMEQRQEWLKKYHPDYNNDGRRAVEVGPNKGTVYPEEVSTLLESKSRLNTRAVDLSKTDYETDLLVIGAGGAGTAAALAAQEAGFKVLVSTKLRHGDSNTVMAEGGIQGADQEGDSPYFHYLDVIGGGHFSNQPGLVAALTNDAPLIIHWLEGLGMMFDKHPDGRMKVRHGGGTCRKRMHSSGDMTGAEIMRVVRDEARNRAEGIKVLEFTPAVEILLDESGNAAGAVLYNLETKEYYVVRAKAVIVATGGFGRLHIQGFPTTNHYGATADGVVMAYRAGVSLQDLDSTQYHPTGAIYPEQNVGLLITEKVRGLGAQLLNIEGEQFCFPLEPRDVESACVIRECREIGQGIVTPTGRHGVWLDSPMIDMLHGEGAVRKELPAKYIQFKRYDIDISKVPMLIYPTLHYQNGGISINEWSETSVKGLYSAGEVAGGVHGRNRLMGNSLLDVLVFGRRAGIKAAEYMKSHEAGKKLSLNHVEKFNKEIEKAGIDNGIASPLLLPDYAPDHVRTRQVG